MDFLLLGFHTSQVQPLRPRLVVAVMEVQVLSDLAIGSGIAIRTEINMMKTSLRRKAQVGHAEVRIERAPQRRDMAAGI